MVTAIAMTEPTTGSDLAGIRTTAVRDGDHYVVNGSKTFISSAFNCDLVIVAVKTDPTQRHRGMSLLVVDADTPDSSGAVASRRSAARVGHGRAVSSPTCGCR